MELNVGNMSCCSQCINFLMEVNVGNMSCFSQCIDFSWKWMWEICHVAVNASTSNETECGKCVSISASTSRGVKYGQICHVSVTVSTFSRNWMWTYAMFQSCIEFSRRLNMEMKLYRLSISVWSSWSVKTLVNMPHFSPFINFSLRWIGKYNYTMFQSMHRLLGQLNTCKWVPDFSHDVSRTWQRNYTMFQSAHRFMGGKYALTSHGVEYENIIIQCLNFWAGNISFFSQCIDFSWSWI